MRINKFLSELITQLLVGAALKPATSNAWNRSSFHTDSNGRDWIDRING